MVFMRRPRTSTTATTDDAKQAAQFDNKTTDAGALVDMKTGLDSCRKNRPTAISTRAHRTDRLAHGRPAVAAALCCGELRVKAKQYADNLIATIF